MSAKPAGPEQTPRARIAVFAGPTATIQNSAPLVTSQKARAKFGLPPLAPAGRFDALRPQRLAAPVTVYVEQFSAHPLEGDAAELYAPPDGYVDATGAFHKERQGPDDRPVYEVTLSPDDGLYALPYMGRQRDGSAWESECAFPLAPAEQSRQTFYPDASRIVEEIDRFGVDGNGLANSLAVKADFDFYRPAPSGGYTKGQPANQRTDVGQGDVPPEHGGDDFFFYRPTHLRTEPPLGRLAVLTNMVQQALSSAPYDGAIWLEGSPSVEETTYWLGLLINTKAPIVGNSSQRPHGTLSNDGDRNIVDAADYITSGIWKGPDGADSVGAVVIVDEVIFAAREVQKADARPGGYVATGGHGGVVGSIGQPGPPVLTFRPARRHTACSEVKLPCLPASVVGTTQRDGQVVTISVPVKDADGGLLPAAMPTVTFTKSGRYLPVTSRGPADTEADILARLEQNLRAAPLAGFVAEGGAPFGGQTHAMDEALTRAVFSGMPVVKVGRGNAEGFVPDNPPHLMIAGSNLTATKARLLLMACLLRFGALPPAADPTHPTADEIGAVRAKLRDFQRVFDTH